MSLALLIAACVPGESNNTASERDAIEAALQGTWQVACFADEDNESTKGRYVFKDGVISVTGTTYSDSSCESIFAQFTLEADFAIGDETVLASGQSVSKFDSTVTKLEVAYYDQALIPELNRVSLCGYKDWIEGELKDAFNCSIFSAMKEGIKKDIVMLEEGKLYFGDDDYNEEDGYPTQLESEFATKL